MFFELQLSSELFGRLIRNRLRRMHVCPNHTLVDASGILAGTPGAELVVDRIDIGSVTSVQREQTLDRTSGSAQLVPSATQVVWIFSYQGYPSFYVPFMQVRQELMVHLVKAADLELNGPNPSPVAKSITLFAVFNVSLRAANQTQGGGPLTLKYELAYLDLGAYDPFLSDAQRLALQQFAMAVQLPATTLDLGALGAVLKREVKACNAGITCDTQGNFVVIRADIEVSYEDGASLSREFFVGEPEDIRGGRGWAILVDSKLLTQQAYAKAKQALEGAPKVRLRSGPHVHWNPGATGVDIAAQVELADACPFFVDDIDMDVDVAIRASFAIPAGTPNILRMHYHLSGDPSDIAEEIACAVTGGLLWPFIGPLFLKDEEVGEGILMYLAGTLTGALFTSIGILAVIETKKMSQDLSSKLGATCVKQDDENYECNEPLNITMSLSPPLNSRLDAEEAVGLPRGLVLRGSISNFGELGAGRITAVHVCPFAWGVRGRCTGNGRSNFRISNQASVSVFGDEPMEVCSVFLLPDSDPAGEFLVQVEDNSIIVVPQFKPQYVANPYPCRLRVITTRGVRTVTLKPPAALGDSEREQLESERLAQHLSCYYWEKIHTPLEKIEWLVDPPPYAKEDVLQFWQVAVRGLGAEELIRVFGQNGNPMLTAHPSRAGVVNFTLLQGGRDAITELSLELSGPRRDDSGHREMTVQQRALVRKASLPVGNTVRSLHFEGGKRSRRLVMTDDTGQTTWDVGVPRAPLLLNSARLAMSAERSRSTLPVLYSGKRIGNAPSQALSTAFARIRDRLGSVEAVGSPKVGGVRETLYVRSGAEGTLYDIAEPTVPRRLHVYHQPGWFEGTAMSGDLIAKYDMVNGVIDLYVAELEPACR